jgi:GTP cyclohydrolase II
MNGTLKSEVQVGEPIEIPTELGYLAIRHISFESQEGIVITGQVPFSDPAPVRVHSSCLFSESLLSIDCDCSAQLQEALRIITSEGGLLIYLYEEGRGAGLSLKIEAIRLQQIRGYDTADAYRHLGLVPDPRSYLLAAAAILQIFGADRGIELLTNNPDRVNALEKAGVKVVRRRPLICRRNELVDKYLLEKAKVLGHIFE